MTYETDREPDPIDAQYADWKKKTTIFLSGQTVSMFGSMLVQYAIIWYITLETQSGMVLTIATICGFLPQILISLFAGVWADRYNRKVMIIFADVMIATSTLILAVVFLMGYGQLWLLYLISAIRSVGAGIQAPAVSALLPQIVPNDRLLKVNGLNSTIQPFIMILSPIASGTMLSLNTLESIFFVDVVTAALAVGLLLALKVPPHRRAMEEITTGGLEDLKEGVRFIHNSKPIRTLLGFFAFVMLFVGPIAFLTPLLIARSHGEEVWRLTANEVTFFVGMILGGILMTAWGGFKNHFRTIGLGCIAMGLLIAGLGLAGNFYIYLAIMFLVGIPMPLLNVPTTTLLQETVAQEMQGRVFSVMGLIQTSMLPLSMVIFGPLSDTVSIELLLVISGVLMAMPGIWIFFRPAWQPEPVLNPAD